MTQAALVNQLVADRERGRISEWEFLTGLGYSEDEITHLLASRGLGIASEPWTGRGA